MHMHFSLRRRRRVKGPAAFISIHQRREKCQPAGRPPLNVHFFHVNSLPYIHIYTGAHHFYCFHCQRRGRRLRKYFQRSTFESEIRAAQIDGERYVCVCVNGEKHAHGGALEAKR